MATKSEIKKSTLAQFVERGGYNIVTQEAETGRLKGVSRAVEITGLSDETIRSILKANPLPPLKTLPKYVDDFYASEGYKLIEEKYGHRRYFKTILRPTAIEAFNILESKDPISWDKSDFEKLWKHPGLQDSQTEWIRSDRACQLRNVMRATGKANLLEEFKTKKRKAGGKRHWYLEDVGIIAIIGEIYEVDTLLMLYEGIDTGARFSGLVTTRPDKINYKESILQIWEPKVKEWVDKDIPKCLLELITRYIDDFDIKGEEKLYRSSYASYLNRLKTAGKKANVKHTVSTHILKHTFVTQALDRGVSLEVAALQCGTNPQTLQDYYLGVNRERRRHELIGEEYKTISFPEWIANLSPHFMKRYEEIKNNCRMTEKGIELKQQVKVRKAKLVRTPKPRKTNWEAIGKMITNFEALSNEKQATARQRFTIPYWKRALELHKQGLGDEEVVQLAKAKEIVSKEA